jgi:hypothetical protein
MPTAPSRTDHLAGAVRHTAGLLERASHVASEITSLTQEVHAAPSPLALLVDNGRPARLVYGGIRFGFHGAGRLAAPGGRVAGRDPEPDPWLDVQSAANNAFGHLLDGRGGAFALPMTLRRPAGRRRAQRLVVFLHGLCMNERELKGSQDAPFSSNTSPRVGGVRRHWVCGHGSVGGGLVTEQGPPNLRSESSWCRTRVALG